MYRGDRDKTGMSVPAVVYRMLAVLCLACLAAACASRGPVEPRMTAHDFQQAQEGELRVADLNNQLLSLAVASAQDDAVYRVGPDDELAIRIFNVDELSRNYRVDAAGRIQLALVGPLDVAGHTLGEVERLVAEHYGRDYLRNPQVSVSVAEYRSQQFTVLGAVARPQVYATPRRVTLVEAMAQAGGMAANAGNMIYLTDRVHDPDSGEMTTRSLIVDIDDLMDGARELNVVLGEGAIINVPPAGSVFVEGAVEKPGVYARQGDTTVLKAIAMAGGLKFEAQRSTIRVLRRNQASGQWSNDEVDFRSIRENPADDYGLRDGDIVLVESSLLRSGLANTWDFIRYATFLGFRPF